MTDRRRIVATAALLSLLVCLAGCEPRGLQWQGWRLVRKPPPAPAGGGYEWRGGRWVRTPAVGASSQAGQIALIRQYIEQKDEGQAVKTAEKFLKENPDHELREDAIMLAGQAQFNRGLYYQAFELFEKQLDEFPNGRLADRALDREFKVGEKFLLGHKRIIKQVIRLPAESEGVEILERVTEHVPSSRMAERALLRIADHFFHKGDYERAAERYDQFLEVMPKSNRATYAMLRGAMATYRTYRGPQFNGTPLREAEQRFKRINQIYPVLAKREKIPQTLETIYSQRAERVFTTAEFYLRTNKTSSAAYYYRRTIDGFPQTPWAEQSVSALRQLGHDVAAPSRTKSKSAAKPPEWHLPPTTGAAGKTEPDPEKPNWHLPPKSHRPDEGKPAGDAATKPARIEKK